MYELIQLTEHDYYIDCPAKIGLIRVSDDEVVLIDSGSDKDAGKKVYRILDSNKWKLRAIFNTHSHADHSAGNQLFARKDRVQYICKRDGMRLREHPAFGTDWPLWRASVQRAKAQVFDGTRKPGTSINQ